MRLGFVISGVIVCFLAICCKRDSWKNLGKTEAAAWMLKDSSDQVIKWELCQVYDPYQGGQVMKVDSLFRKTIEIYRDGKFKINDRQALINGQWKLNLARTEILFVCKERNGVKLKQKDPLYRQISQIRKISRDTMILAWQGRHGYVEELYSKNCFGK